MIANPPPTPSMLARHPRKQPPTSQTLARITRHLSNLQDSYAKLAKVIFILTSKNF